jgi:hypothetical protein
LQDYAAAQQKIDFRPLLRHIAGIEAPCSVNWRHKSPRLRFGPGPQVGVPFPELPFSRGSFRTRFDAPIPRAVVAHIASLKPHDF